MFLNVFKMIQISGILVVLTLAVHEANGLVTTSRKCSIKHSTKFGGLFADCRGRNLQQVPILIKTITALDLSENNITLQRNDFNYPSLIYLNLSHNGLACLPQDVFIWCQNLSILDLGRNTLIYNAVTYPQNIFRPLRHLRILNLGLNDNTGSGDYPDDVFNPLVNLEELTIDTFGEVKFGPGFGGLDRLRVLNLSGRSTYCKITILHNDALSIFKSSNISMFDMSYCTELTEIQTKALAPLQHLAYLNLEHATSLGLLGCLSALQSSQGTNMSFLNFQNVDEVWNTKDDQLFSEKMSYLENTCVSQLNIAENHIMYINFTSLFSKNNRFSRCIKKLDLHGNFIYGYSKQLSHWSFAMHLLFMHSIEYIDISGFVCYHKSGKAMPSRLSLWRAEDDKSFAREHEVSFSSGHGDELLSQKRDLFVIQDLDDRSSRDSVTVLSQEYDSIFGVQEHNRIIYPSLKNLKTIIADAVASEIKINRHLYFSTPNVFEILSISKYNKVKLEGSVNGLNRLKTLKICHNNNMTLSVSFFDTFPSLENIFLNDVSLPRDYFFKHGRRLFSKVTKLKLLDLSGNGIRRLSTDIFRDNTNLETLILSNNMFDNIPFDIYHCPNLLDLKLNDNKIAFLDKFATDSLDKHALKKTFVLNLSGNKFVCLCESVYFVFWLQQNGYTHIEKNYLCTTEDAFPVSIEDVDAELLWQRCTGRIWLSIAVPLFILLLLISVSSFLVVKHKTQTIYFFKNLIRKCVACPRRKDFKFDICLCYSEKDWRNACLYLAAHLEKRYGYKVYLHDRNSIPGDLMANSIMYGINNSWKTILLLTENFLEDGWSWFTMHVAIVAVTWRTPYRLLVMRDCGQPCEIPNCILCVVDEDRIIATPCQDTDASWDMLVRHIE